jgi:hypothetical protein
VLDATIISIVIAIAAFRVSAVNFAVSYVTYRRRGSRVVISPYISRGKLVFGDLYGWVRSSEAGIEALVRKQVPSRVGTTTQR